MTFFDKIKHFFRLRFRHGVKINITYPPSWNDMSQEDFRNVCTILSEPHGRKEALFLCLCALAHIRPDSHVKYKPEALGDNVVFIIGGESYVISPKVIREACSDLEYIFDGIGLPPCPLPGIDRKLYGISFGNYYHIDAYMMQYAATKDETWLKQATVKLTSGRVRKLLPWQRQGLPIWWNGVKHYLAEKYPFVLREGGEGAVSDRTLDEVLLDLLGAMNDNKPQNNEYILKSDVHSVLHCLNQIYEKNAHQ